MATIALQIAGTALGSFLGGPFGAALGSALGGTLGAMADRALLGGGRVIEGPRLTTRSGITAEEGAPVPRIYGRVRLGGQVIWATEFEEERRLEKSGGSGGKATGGSGPRTERYSYFANVAIGLCEGPVSFVRRVWADGEELDLNAVTMRFHAGGETQAADPLIVAKQGHGDIPAFRGLAYVVFERLPLADYGNRLPVFSFEVVRAATGLPERLRAINIIPGSTEFGYATSPVREDFGLGSSRAINRAQWTHPTDWAASLDALTALAPNLERATLISAWFGDDLRAGTCTLRPKVEKADKTTSGMDWRCAGLNRASAEAVSANEGRPDFGGTPADRSVIEAIRDLKARGLGVALHPFILMDISAGNARPDPWSGAAAQPAFPWRGRITCDPAPGRPGSPEGGAALDAQISAFVGMASLADFALSGDEVVYSGPAEWSLRRMVLHHAMLARAAGGIETFILASELVGLTHCAGAAGFPMADALAALAADLRVILGPETRITYAADWTEYGARVRQGGADVRFPLDTLWSHPAIDAIGIDFYPPLADWRAGEDHADAAFAPDARDPAYLRDRLGAGEAHEWFYADEPGRAAQVRLPITDGAYGKPWIFRQKDLVGWWSNPHVERMGGVETGAPTAFVPRGKPILLTEIGCPAVDKGANQPNVFPDPKSSENSLPHFSNGARDDLAQWRVLEAIHDRFDAESPGFDPARNPVSPLYGERMIDPGFIAPWAWDARPYPAFPRQVSLWADGENWLRGHWLNGRLEALPLDRLLAMIHADFGLEPPAGLAPGGFLDGYVIDRPMSARAALEPLAASLGFTAQAAPEGIVYADRPARLAAVLAEDDLVAGPDGGRVEIIRRQESELPRRLTLGFIDGENDFRQATAEAEITLAESRREETEAAAINVPRAMARRLAEHRLHDIWNGRETFRFRLRSGLRALEPGDLVTLPPSCGARRVLLTRITDGAHREVEARAYDPEPPGLIALADELPAESGAAAIAGAPHVRLLELPLPREGGLVVAALGASPWRGPYPMIASAGGAVQTLGVVDGAARFGRTLTPLMPGPLWRWDHAASLDLQLGEGAVSSLAAEAVLAGGNALALIDAAGGIEIVLFRQAQLVGLGRYRLSGLLRGLGGSEPMAGRLLAAGAEAVLIDDALAATGIGAESIGTTRSLTLLPAGRDLGDRDAVTASLAVTGIALRPLAPVHPRARREAGGIAFGFIRRVRQGGDNLDLFEVPVGEDREEYLCEILDGAAVRRSLVTNMPGWFYPAAEEIADFGAPRAEIDIRVRQIGVATGPGFALEARIPIR